MPVQPTANIWHNGTLIPWDRAQIHVMSHVVHYGSSVFEGIRCYTQPNGAGVFRLQEHMQRLIDSAKIYRMPLGYSVDQLSTAVVCLLFVILAVRSFAAARRSAGEGIPVRRTNALLLYEGASLAAHDDGFRTDRQSSQPASRVRYANAVGVG